MIQDEKSALKNAKIVQQVMWDNNVRATKRGLPTGVVCMAGKWNVYATSKQTEGIPRGCHYLAFVTDYGDHKKVRLFDRSGRQVKAPFYRVGRLGAAL